MLACTLAYSYLDGSFLAFLIIFFLPDLGMIAYLKGPRFGALIYNLAHTTALPFLLLIGLYVAGSENFMLYPLIWLAHIGFDRMLGYGLKLPSGFHDTHLGRIGKKDA